MQSPRRIHWKRTPTKAPKHRPGLLSPEQQDNVRRAIWALHRHHGTLVRVARMLGVRRTSLDHVLSSRGAVTAALALETARVAGVTMNDVLEGQFPRPMECYASLAAEQQDRATDVQ